MCSIVCILYYNTIRTLSANLITKYVHVPVHHYLTYFIAKYVIPFFY